MNAVDILYSHNLKRTSCREGIIDVVQNSSHALSEQEIRTQLEGNYDRSTFYRSFKTLVKHHIIHKIVVDNQVVKYALDLHLSHKKEHAHFYCRQCQVVKCVDNLTSIEYNLPIGYSYDEIEVLIKGFCAGCQNQAVI